MIILPPFSSAAAKTKSASASEKDGAPTQFREGQMKRVEAWATRQWRRRNVFIQLQCCDASHRANQQRG